MAELIHQGDEGQAVRDFQHHLNDRLRARGEELVPINGKAGPKLIERAAFAAWFLGALMDTVGTVQAGTIPVGVQEIIADPDGREPAQLQRARERRGQPFPGTMGTMFDTADDPGPTFHGLAVDAVAAYGNGSFANHAKAVAAFPNAHVLKIDVKGEHIGNAGDFEPGDMAIEHADPWAKQRVIAGIHRPVIYFSVSKWPAIMQSLQAAGLYRKRRPHLDGPLHRQGPPLLGGVRLRRHRDSRRDPVGIAADARNPSARVSRPQLGRLHDRRQLLDLAPSVTPWTRGWACAHDRRPLRGSARRRHGLLALWHGRRAPRATWLVAPDGRCVFLLGRQRGHAHHARRPTPPRCDRPRTGEAGRSRYEQNEAKRFARVSIPATSSRRSPIDPMSNSRNCSGRRSTVPHSAVRTAPRGTSRHVAADRAGLL